MITRARAFVLSKIADVQERLAEDAVVALAFFARRKRAVMDDLDRAEQELLDEAHRLREQAVQARQRVYDFLEQLDRSV